MNFWKRITHGSNDLGTVANWTPARAKHYERETFKYHGIRETAYTWARKFRPKALRLASRKSA